MAVLACPSHRGEVVNRPVAFGGLTTQHFTDMTSSALEDRLLTARETMPNWESYKDNWGRTKERVKQAQAKEAHHINIVYQHCVSLHYFLRHALGS